MPTIKKKVIEMKSKIFKEGELSPDQRIFFVLGYVPWFRGSPKGIPFNSDEHRKSLWEKNREDIMKLIYLDSPMDIPWKSANQLRPAEWFRKDAPEQKRVLNDAKFIKFDECGHSIWDSMPLEETDSEYLSRLNLLTGPDILKMEKDSFKFEEERDLEFRSYCLREEPVQC